MSIKLYYEIANEGITDETGKALTPTEIKKIVAEYKLKQAASGLAPVICPVMPRSQLIFVNEKDVVYPAHSNNGKDKV